MPTPKDDVAALNLTVTSAFLDYLIIHKGFLEELEDQINYDRISPFVFENKTGVDANAIASCKTFNKKMEQLELKREFSFDNDTKIDLDFRSMLGAQTEGITLNKNVMLYFMNGTFCTDPFSSN